VSVEKDLEAGVKVLDSADLDFSRYADTLFEVLFAGGRLSTGGNLADDQKEKLTFNVSYCSSRLHHKSIHMAWVHALTLFGALFVQVLASDATPEALLPYIKVFQSLIRCAEVARQCS
jgi:hypothetical protein